MATWCNCQHKMLPSGQESECGSCPEMEARTIARRRGDGRIEAILPKPRTSNPNFLSDLLADWQADQKQP
jgi:hypothetical protein